MGTLNEDLTAIKCVEDTLDSNKVARFSYTEEAYRCNCADGVTVYDVDNEQNIPVGNAEIMKVNETVLSKGWRSQASSLTRMMMNHFIGRLSYNVNKLTDNVSGLLDTVLSHLGVANGLATLDATGRIPASQLPVTATEYKGSWNANTNTPQLADGMAGATNGDFYIVSVGGTQDLGSGSIQFFANDRVIYNGSIWERLSAGDVKTVNNVQPVDGNITLSKADIGLGNVDNTADANKNVASAVNSTCFNGYTYAQAKADIRSGLGTVTVSDVTGTVKTPIVLCTGGTTVGRATQIDLAYGAGTLYGVNVIQCLGSNTTTYRNIKLLAGNCNNQFEGAGENQYASACLCGANGIFYAPVGLSTGIAYTGEISNVGAGATNCDVTIFFGSTNAKHKLTAYGLDGSLWVCRRNGSSYELGTVYAKIVATGNIYTHNVEFKAFANTNYIQAVGNKICNGSTYTVPVLTDCADRLSNTDNYINLRCFLRNGAPSNLNSVLHNRFVLLPTYESYLAYTCCDCSDVTCCIKDDVGSGNVLHMVGDAYYFTCKCCFAVYCSHTPIGHNWMGTTLCNNTCVDLCVDLHGGYNDCYEGCSISLKKGCSYTFCSCIYNNSDAWAYVRIDPACSGGLNNLTFVETRQARCYMTVY